MNDKQNAMLKAIEAVKNGATVSAAARQHGVPRTTLVDKIRGRYPVECSKGPATVLSKDEENHLKRWIIFMADSGFPITKAQLLDSVSLLIKKMQRNNPFQNGRPGRHWFEAFIRRHPEVGQRVAQNLTQTRALVKENNLRMWFKEVEEYFESSQLQEVIKDPRRIFNCDESAFFLSPSDNKVLAKRGAKNVFNIIPSSEKECVTVLITANAAGELAPPMVLFKLKSIPHKISKTAPNDWGLGFTPKGWMTGESFYEYITNVFYPWLVKSQTPLPIIFFLDGHCSHTTLPLSNFCREKKIQLVALYPNATHILQPMDVAVFRPLKRIWKKNVYDWRNDNQFAKLKKENFCPLLDKTLKQLDPISIKNGFRKCGLSPFDANSVDYSKCITSHPKTLTKSDNKNPIPSETTAHFKFFESQISSENLKAFYTNKGSTWKGDKSLEGLFYVWRQMQDQNNLSSAITFTYSTQVTAQETSNIDESSGDFGNFTGLTNILDLNEISDLVVEDLSSSTTKSLISFKCGEHPKNVGKIEVYENLDGTLTKIMDVEIPPKELSQTNFEDKSNTIPELGTVMKMPHSSCQVLRTQGSKPIYITSSKTITTDNETKTTRSLSSYLDLSPIPVQLIPTEEEMPTMTQTLSNNEPLHITPPNKVNQIFSKKRKLAPDDTVPDNAQTIENITHCDTPPSTTVVQALTEHDNCNQPKITRYYGDLVVPTPFKDALFWPETPSSITKSKVKLPSVITSDRWQIFAQKKIEAKTKKEENKVKAKDKCKKSKLGKSNKQSKKRIIPNETVDLTTEDWFCRLCQTSTKLDMIQCVTCKTWYHTACAEVSPNEITFTCLYCNVAFDE